METEPDQMVTENANPGKRKRSSRTGSPTIGQQNIRTSKESFQDAAGAPVLQATPKKQRLDNVPLDADPNQPIPVGSDHACHLSSQRLPPEVMHRILSFVDPFSLGRLMRVNKDLHNLLLPRHESLGMSTGTNASSLSAENIWSCSRNTYCPDMPHPLNSVTEVDMFKLVHGKRCQNCELLPKPTANKQEISPWNSGPGPTGVRTIWPFKVKSCADCLKPLLMKETELTQLGCSQLRPGLVSASFTPSLHYVMSITMKAPLPPKLKLTSYYYRPHVDTLLQSAPNPQDQGGACYHSWIQQLDSLRQEANTDVDRLEAWELSRNAPSRHLAARSNMTSRSSASGSSLHSETISRSYMTARTGGHQALTATSSHSGRGSSMLSSSLLNQDTGLRQFLPRPNHGGGFDLAQNAVTFPPPQRYMDNSDEPLCRSDQPSSDVIRLKNEKRIDIQQRCMELIPPILPQTLDCLPAFRRAIQILMPLDHASWETLKVQLLNERRTLELSQVAASETPSQADLMDTSTIGRAVTPEAEFVEVDLRKQASRPVREKLYEFAREYVHRRYASGTNLTHSSAPQFAADVLLYVRQRFYQNQANEDAAFTQRGEQPPDEGPSGIRTRTLKLEHMRYIFDTSIKPFTEFVRKDLFLCSACDTQGRHFAFEAIIQHFASKHTDAFSRGNAVVYWKAEWPVQPPFEPEPGRDLDTASSLSYPPTGIQLTVRDQPQTAVSTTLIRRMDDEPVRYVRHDDIMPTPSAYYSATPSLTQVRDAVPYTSDPALTSRLIYHSDSALFGPSPVQGALAYDSHFEHHTTRDENRRLQQRNANSFLDPDSHRHYPRDVPMTEADSSATVVYEREQPEAAAAYYLDRMRPSHYIEGRDAEQSHYRHGSHNSYAGSEARFAVSEGHVNIRHRSRIHDVQPLDSPSRNSPASSTHYQSETGIRRSNAQSRASGLQQNAAERFLETFDLEGVQGREKETSRPSSVLQPSRYLPLEEEPREVFFDRRANVSHYRRATQPNLDIEMEQEITADAATSDGFWDRTVRGPDPAYARPYHVRRESGLIRLEDVPHDDMPGYNQSPPSRVRYYERFVDDPRSLEPQAHQYQRVRYVDEYGRELDPPSPDARYTQPGPYREITTERHYYHDDPNRPNVYYDRPSYDDHEARLGHEPRRYYVDRPIHDQHPDLRYIEPGHSPRREIIYEDDPRHPQYQPHAARPPMDDPRYERR